MAGTGNAGEYDHLVKLLLLGDYSVGKSSLIKRFCQGCFDTNTVTTMGIDFFFKTVERNSRKLKLQVWDTAGQERFRTITPMFYRSAMGAIIVYDICNERTFEQVEYFATQLSQHGIEGVQQILVGNKCDLEAKRKVAKEDGQALATKFNMTFFETSAKTGDSVEEAFLHIADNVVNAPPAGSPPLDSFSVDSLSVDVARGCAC